MATIQPIDIEGGVVTPAAEEEDARQPQLISTCCGMTFQTTALVVSIFHIAASASALVILLYVAFSPSLAERFGIIDDDVSQELNVIWVILEVVAGLGIVASCVPLVGALSCRSDLVMAGGVWLTVEFIALFVLLTKPAFRHTFGARLVEVVMLPHLLLALWFIYVYYKLWVELEEKTGEEHTTEPNRDIQRHTVYHWCCSRPKNPRDEILERNPPPESAPAFTETAPTIVTRDG